MEDDLAPRFDHGGAPPMKYRVRRERYSKNSTDSGPRDILILVCISCLRREGVRLDRSGTAQYLNWCWIADQFGYFDQAHFIKEFKFFYGKTPAEYSTSDRYISDVPTARPESASGIETAARRARRPRVRSGIGLAARHFESTEFLL